MIDVSDIIHDPDFVQTFQVIPVTATLTEGESTDVEAPGITEQGIVLPAKNDSLMVLPEGERNQETVAIYSNLQLTMGDQVNRKADIVLYNGQFYRVAFTKFYAQCNVWYALAVRFYRA